MVLDSLANAARYQGMHPLFAQAFTFLQEADLASLPTGIHELKGRELFAILSDATGISKQEATLEVHRKYIDIQFVVSGTDHMGWKSLAFCADPSDPYHEARDAAFFPDRTDNWFDVPAGYFTIFYPDDAHAAMVTQEKVRKVVLKIAVEQV
ncbi:YhcH/YjgK/YiaL family protein [Pontibacter sp. E15-1]|uniref:YhcH/YjgK/YiaL family protein n=1 Tax=Pontibacter sp. E15-1 TaxID=2919918 RepID=UPI001F4F7CF6|nr:YhcH/YjgK/YiaL family protein [Pontibacter sp. E15-1]MCJ8166640.1 YhcH/YjgK/YiaL family protein [Pontibacter sp. E15-1]